MDPVALVATAVAGWRGRAAEASMPTMILTDAMQVRAQCASARARRR